MSQTTEIDKPLNERKMVKDTEIVKIRLLPETKHLKLSQKIEVDKPVSPVHERKMLKDTETVEVRYDPEAKLLKCDFCDVCSYNKDKMKKHVTVVHEKKNPLICDKCGEVFKSNKGFYLHIKKSGHMTPVHERKKPKKTKPVYKIQTYKPKTLCQFLYKYDKDSSYKNGTRVCGESFNSREELISHLKSEHNSQKIPNAVPIKESGHTQEPSEKSMSPVHENKHPENPKSKDPVHVIIEGDQVKPLKPKTSSVSIKPYKCDSCEECFGHFQFLNAHSKKVHNQKNSLIKCAICDESFKGRVIFDRHLTISHSKNDHFKCLDCNKEFTSKEDFKNHNYLKHGQRFDLDRPELKMPGIRNRKRIRNDKRKTNGFIKLNLHWNNF